eukprot:2053285-Rhodomonas_salina.3
MTRVRCRSWRWQCRVCSESGRRRPDSDARWHARGWNVERCGAVCNRRAGQAGLGYSGCRQTDPAVLDLAVLVANVLWLVWASLVDPHRSILNSESPA